MKTGKPYLKLATILLSQLLILRNLHILNAWLEIKSKTLPIGEYRMLETWEKS